MLNALLPIIKKHVSDISVKYGLFLDGSIVLFDSSDAEYIYTDFFFNLTREDFLKEWCEAVFGVKFSDKFHSSRFTQSGFYKGSIDFVERYSLKFSDGGHLNIDFYGELGDESELLIGESSEGADLLYDKLALYKDLTLDSVQQLSKMFYEDTSNRVTSVDSVGAFKLDTNPGIERGDRPDLEGLGAGDAMGDVNSLPFGNVKKNNQGGKRGKYSKYRPPHPIKDGQMRDYSLNLPTTHSSFSLKEVIDES